MLQLLQSHLCKFFVYSWVKNNTIGANDTLATTSSSSCLETRNTQLCSTHWSCLLLLVILEILAGVNRSYLNGIVQNRSSVQEMRNEKCICISNHLCKKDLNRIYDNGWGFRMSIKGFRITAAVLMLHIFDWLHIFLLLSVKYVTGCDPKWRETFLLKWIIPS